MSVTKSSDKVNLRMMPMQDLRPIVENTLRQEGFSTELENLSDNELMFTIKQGGYNSHLTLNRTRHRPLVINIEADYNYHKNQQEQIRKQNKRSKQSGQNRGFGGMYRTYWLLFIFAGLIIAVLSFFSSIILSVVQALTPGWSPLEQALGLSGAVLAFTLFWIFVLPGLMRQRNRGKSEKDQRVISILQSRLETLNQELTGSDKVKCWSCFKEIDYTTSACPYCEADQS